MARGFLLRSGGVKVLGASSAASLWHLFVLRAFGLYLYETTPMQPKGLPREELPGLDLQNAQNNGPCTAYTFFCFGDIGASFWALLEIRVHTFEELGRGSGDGASTDSSP